MNLRYAWHVLNQNPLTIVGMVIVTFIFFAALFGSRIIPYPEDVEGKVNIEMRLRPPSKDHWFGTDELGRDIFSRVVYGTRTSLMVGMVVTSLAMLIGIPLGVISGYKGGKIDWGIMQVTAIFMSIPALLLSLSISVALGPGIINAMLAIGIAWWPFYCRLVRGVALSLRELVFIEAAKSINASDFRVITRHILPNCLNVIIVQVTMQFGYAILMAAALGFLGVGAQPPMAEWGLMISTGRQFIPKWWWVSLFPGIAIYISVFGFSVLGDGLRDILDPRLRK
jgi:peptide/nickel transport system permease protein